MSLTDKDLALYKKCKSLLESTSDKKLAALFRHTNNTVLDTWVKDEQPQFPEGAAQMSAAEQAQFLMVWNQQKAAQENQFRHIVNELYKLLTL